MIGIRQGKIAAGTAVPFCAWPWTICVSYPNETPSRRQASAMLSVPDAHAPVGAVPGPLPCRREEDPVRGCPNAVDGDCGWPLFHLPAV